MKKEKKSSIFWILIIFFVLFSIWQLWVPEALDDWRWGSEVGIMRLKMWFEGYNGRYFGDILVIVLTRLPIVLRSMAISGIMTAMLYLIYQLTEYKILSFLICAFFVVNIPISLMSQTYGWVSGFSNFCVSATMILGFLLYHISIFKEKKVSKLKTGFSMINAFLGSLVLENSTVYLIVLSIAFLIIYGVQYKKLHKGMLLHLIMVGIGAFWMFSNSAYLHDMNSRRYWKNRLPFLQTNLVCMAALTRSFYGSLHQKGAWSLCKSSVHLRKKAPCLPQKRIFRSRSPLSQASALFQLLILFHMDIIKSTHRMINRCCQIKDRE